MVFDTPRLVLRQLDKNLDCAFVIALLNSDGWLKYIGDRNVKNVEQAEAYIQNWLNSYKTNGFGLWAVVEKQTQRPIGLCGLIRRDKLPHVDIGFAFLPDFIGKGYAKEASTATLRFAFGEANLDKVIAITLPENIASRSLLEAIGLRYVHDVDWDGERLLVYEISKAFWK